MKMRKLFGFLFLALPFTFFACASSPMPINEMMAARTALDSTLEVKADKLFPDEYAEIVSDFSSPHKMMVDGKFDTVKSSAESITKKSNELYAKSLPIAAKESIESAEELMEDAVQVNADIFYLEKFNSAKALLEDAVKDYENEAYLTAFDKATEAEDEFEILKRDSIAQKDILKDAITEVHNTLDEAAEYNSDVHAAEFVELSLLNLETAKQCYENVEIKRGFAALEAAKLNADQALAISLEMTAEDELAAARSIIDRASSSNTSELIDEVEAAKELYENAEWAFQEERFPDSIELSREAYKIASLVVYSSDAGRSIAHGQESRAQESSRSQQDSGEFTTYKVERRANQTDTLWRIAEKFYNNSNLWPKIFEANRDVIKNPNRIFPGQILKIPK